MIYGYECCAAGLCFVSFPCLLYAGKNKGRWSYKERRILLKVMEDELRKTLDPAEMTSLEQGATPERNARLLTIIREKLYQNIHWVDVAAKVKTRNWVQCRQKWWV